MENELGLFGVGDDGWIESNQLWQIDGDVVWHDILCLIVIVIYDWVGTDEETIIMVGMLVNV